MTTSSDRAGWLVVVNGESGSADADATRAVVGRLGEHAPAEQRRTATSDELADVLREADGRVVVVAGGDGSVHAAVASARRIGLADRLTFGLVPLGTGNDLARTLGVPLDPEDAAEALLHAHPRRLDLLTYGQDDIAVNAVHAGVGADAAERAAPMKDRVGALAYPVGALAAGIATRGWDVRVQVDGADVVPPSGERALMVAIGNGCTIGGGTEICPAASLDDGVVDVVVSHAVEPAARAAYGAALLRGTHVERDDVATTTGRVVTVRGERIPYNVDGELVGAFAELTFEVEPGAWTVLAPPA